MPGPKHLSEGISPCALTVLATETEERWAYVAIINHPRISVSYINRGLFLIIYTQHGLLQLSSLLPLQSGTRGAGVASLWQGQEHSLEVTHITSARISLTKANHMPAWFGQGKEGGIIFPQGGEADSAKSNTAHCLDGPG